jgi:hypothetical protein
MQTLLRLPQALKRARLPVALYLQPDGEARERFQAVLRGLESESCAVKRLEVVDLTADQCSSFVEAIAQFRNVEYVSFQFSEETLKRKLMAAFWRNRTLLEANVLGDCLDESDHVRILAFHQRNRNLCTLIHAQVDAVKSGRSARLGALLPSLLFISIDGTGRRNIFDALVRSGDSLGPATASFGSKRIRPTKPSPTGLDRTITQCEIF